MLHRSLPATLLAVTLIPALSGCGETTPDLPRTEVRDSAGIRIVENRLGSVPARRVSAEPIVSTTGSADGETALYRVRAVDRRADGSWVVANGGSREVLILGEDGAVRSVLGRAGDGPGEFAALWGVVVLPGDSILAWDRQNARGTVFSPDGEVARVFTAEGDGFPRGSTLVGRMGDGTLVLQGSRGLGGDGIPDEGVFRPDAIYLRMNDEGGGIEPLATQPGTELFLSVESASGTITAVSIQPFPFHRDAALVVSDTRLVSGVTERAAFTVREQGGQTVEAWRIRVAPEPVEAADWDAAVDWLADRADDADAARRVRSFHAGVDRPAFQPVWEDLFMDETGRLWIQRYRPVGSESPNAWWRLGPDGALEDELTLPDRFRPLWATESRVAGIRTGQLDVEHFEVREIGPATGLPR